VLFAVVFEGKDLVDVDEGIPYASKPMDYYTATKIKGEQMVLAANDSSLATCALRPSGIFGEGDTVMVPTLVRQAKAGKMKYIIGNGKNKWDMTYAGNVAQAHILVRPCPESGRRGVQAGRGSGICMISTAASCRSHIGYWLMHAKD
jgi:sterol-4alpha-carboxylate 3-dehydrogenase (decarboxylating)